HGWGGAGAGGRLQVAQPAVNRPQMVERRSAAEVVPLDERHREAALRRVIGDRQTIDAAADDEHVEGAAGELIEVASHLGHTLSASGCCYSFRVTTTEAVRDYWNHHIHDLEITRHPVGSPG